MSNFGQMNHSPKKSITRLTQSYLLSHPAIRDCLTRNLVNYSALSRVIADELGIDSTDAIIAACRRYAARVSVSSQYERRIRALLREAELKVSTRIAVAIVNQNQDLELLHQLQREVRKGGGEFNIIGGSRVMTIIFSQKYLGQVKEALKGSPRKLTQNLAQLSLSFGEYIESTPGVVAHVYGLLAFSGVNVIEELSCWTDLIVIITESQIATALTVLGQAGIS